MPAIVDRPRASAHPTPTVLSAFSGAGGLDLGLDSAGFNHLGLIEHDVLCRETLSLNRPGWPISKWHDVHEASVKCKPQHFGLKRGELDLLAGAPPCQPFSKAAQWSSKSRRGIGDERSSTVTSFLKLVDSFLPKVVMIENVPSFWKSAVGAESIVRGFFADLAAKGTHYRVEARILNAADFGVPQVRRRVIVIAWRNGGEFKWPTDRFSSQPFTCWDALANIAPKSPPEAKGKWTRLLPSIPEGLNYLWHTDRGEGLELFGYRTKFWSFLLKLAKDRPAWTLAAQPGPGTGPFHWNNRPLATEEMLALQTFPPGWKLAGSYRDHVKMIGNATPPLLAEELGRAVRESILGQSVPRRLIHLPRRAKTTPMPSLIQKVPEDFLPNERKHAAHPGAGKGPKPRLSPQDLSS